MQDRRLVWGGAAGVLVALAVLSFILFWPRWAVSTLDQMASDALGRSVSATGGAHLQFSPLSIRIDGVALSGADAADDSLASAQSMTIPTSFSGLLRRKPDLATISLSGAEFAFLINERGDANWTFPNLKAYAPTRLELDQARLRFYDARNDQSLTVSNIDGVADISAEGGVTFKGTSVINDRLVRIDAELKSLPRVDADGSPLELALATNDGNASFSGRLSTAKVLGLAGPLSLSSTAAGPALSLIGLPLPDGVTVKGGIAIDGVLDSAGRAYAIRNATLRLGDFQAAGDVVADLRSERPKLQANLAAETLWLDPFVPASGARDGNWGRVKLPFTQLRALDVEAGITARKLAYGDFTTGSAQLKATVTAGKLDASAAANLTDGGTANITLKANAADLPPTVSVSLAAQDTAAGPLLAALTGATALTGTGAFSADLSATGETQEELAGTLKGTASLSLTDGRIAGTDLGGLLTAVRQKILPGWSAAPGGTPFMSITGRASIADGIATLADAGIRTAPADFAVKGLVDLLRRGIELSVQPSADGQPLLPVPVIVRGPWEAPKIYPDIPDILKNPEGGFARLQDPGPTPGAGTSQGTGTTQGN